MSNAITLPISVDLTFNFGAYDILDLHTRVLYFNADLKMWPKMGTGNNRGTYNN